MPSWESGITPSAHRILVFECPVHKHIHLSITYECTLVAMWSGHVALAWVWFGLARLGFSGAFGGKTLVGHLAGKRCKVFLAAKDKSL